MDGKQKLIRLEPENEKHLKDLAAKYGESETRIINLFLEKSREGGKSKETIYDHIEKTLKAEKKGRS